MYYPKLNPLSKRKHKHDFIFERMNSFKRIFFSSCGFVKPKRIKIKESKNRPMPISTGVYADSGVYFR